MSVTSKTLPLFLEGRSCGECLLLAADLPEGESRGALLKAVRGLAAGRVDTCTLLLAGLLALGERAKAPDAPARPENGLLDIFRPAGGPGASVAQDMDAPAEFASRFESHARRECGGTSCATISGIDWDRRDPAAAPEGYPPESCVRLADAAVTDLNDLLAGLGQPA